MSILDKDTNFNTIALYLRKGGEITLTDLQETLLCRWTTAHEQMLKMVPNDEIVTLLSVRFDISRTAAYRDLNNAKRLFGKSFPLNRRYVLSLTYEWTVESLKEAKEAKDYLAQANLLKNLTNLAKLIDDTEGLDDVFNQKIIQITAKPGDVGLDPISDAEIEDLLKQYNERPKRLGH